MRTVLSVICVVLGLAASVSAEPAVRIRTGVGLSAATRPVAVPTIRVIPRVFAVRPAGPPPTAMLIPTKWDAMPALIPTTWRVAVVPVLVGR